MTGAKLSNFLPLKSCCSRVEAKAAGGQVEYFAVSILFVFFALLIQKDRGTGPDDVLASYPPREGVVLNPITDLYRHVRR